MLMNLIFGDMLVKSGMAAGAFATGFGGPLATDYNPQFPGPAGDGPTGDFCGEFQTRSSFGISNLPEPSTLVLFGFGLSIVGLYRGIQRGRKGK